MIATQWTGPRVLLVLASALLVSACDETRDPPPAPNPDKAIECLTDGMDAGARPDGGGSLSCGSGEICIQGRCYTECSATEDCGPREMCEDGTCVPGPLVARPDTGPTEDPDAGPIDPCADVVCEESEVCHALSRECVECNAASVGMPRGSPGVCAGARPICDIANGACAALAPAPCAPCNIAADCELDGFMGRCETRQVFEVAEQVCLVECAETEPSCPGGMTCDPASNLCLPAAREACTTWLAGTASASCLSDQDCNPRGESGAFFTDACEGEMAPPPPPDAAGLPDGAMPSDAGPGVAGQCRQPCGVDTDCRNTALVCGADGFCGSAADGGV